jgi:hypothetical protein
MLDLNFSNLIKNPSYSSIPVHRHRLRKRHSPAPSSIYSAEAARFLSLFIMNQFTLLSQVFIGKTLKSKRIDYIRTGHSCEPSVFSDSKLASFVSNLVITVLYTKSAQTSSSTLQARLTKYVLALFQKTHISTSSIMLSLLYCYRLKLKTGTTDSQECLFKSYSGALILADSFLNDNAFSTKSWSIVTGLTKTDVSTLKREMLIQLNFELHCSVSDYAQFLGMLEKHLQLKSTKSMSAKEKMHFTLKNGIKTIPNITDFKETYILNNLF